MNNPVLWTLGEIAVMMVVVAGFFLLFFFIVWLFGWVVAIIWRSIRGFFFL